MESEQDRRQQFSQDLQLSSEAKAVLENPLVQRFFTVNEERLHKLWAATEPSQVAEREAAYDAIYNLQKFKEYFEQFLADEEFALQQLAEMGK